MLKNNSFRSAKTSKINMSSMADVAFLMVIFFWVATSIPMQKGIPMTLPRIDNAPKGIYCGPRYTRDIFINSQNQILMNCEEIVFAEVKENVVAYINSADKNERTNDKNERTNQNRAVISLKGDRGTNYGSYLLVLDQIKAAYMSVRAKELGWSEEKMLHFLENEGNATQEEIKKYNNVVFLYPEVISEAEPTEAERR